MIDDPHDNRPDNETDRVIMDYLQQILTDGTPAPVVPPMLSALLPAGAVSDNIAPFDVNRARKADSVPLKLKAESVQAVTLPFKTAEKPRVLPSLNLLNLKTAPAQEPAPPKPVETLSLPAEPAKAKRPATKSPEIISPKSTPPVAPVKPAVAPSIKPPAEVDPAVLLQAADSILGNEKLPPVQEWHDNGRPAWAQERFECLIFKVAGLKLAVPLKTLGAIHRIDRKFNALPHQSEWFLGILQTPASGNIKVLDTALCVMPERYDPVHRDTLAFVITIHGYTWGLACHEVEQSITLQPDQIKWRTQRGKRPWLAGTVIDHMCALVDTDGFRDVIANAEKPR